MSNYTRGRSFEHYVKEKLEAQGWWVTRSAGSKGEADLIAIRPGCLSNQIDRVWLVQCKAGKTKISGKEKAALIELAGNLCVTAAVAFKDKRGKVCVQPVTI